MRLLQWTLWVPCSCATQRTIKVVFLILLLCFQMFIERGIECLVSLLGIIRMLAIAIRSDSLVASILRKNWPSELMYLLHVGCSRCHLTLIAHVLCSRFHLTHGWLTSNKLLHVCVLFIITDCRATRMLTHLWIVFHRSPFCWLMMSNNVIWVTSKVACCVMGGLIIHFVLYSSHVWMHEGIVYAYYSCTRTWENDTACSIIKLWLLLICIRKNCFAFFTHWTILLRKVLRMWLDRLICTLHSRLAAVRFKHLIILYNLLLTGSLLRILAIHIHCLVLLYLMMVLYWDLLEIQWKTPFSPSCTFACHLFHVWNSMIWYYVILDWWHIVLLIHLILHLNLIM